MAESTIRAPECARFSHGGIEEHSEKNGQLSARMLVSGECKAGPSPFGCSVTETGSPTARSSSVRLRRSERRPKRAKACESLRSTINRDTGAPLNIAELVDHYTEKELSDDGAKAYSTREMYQSYIRCWIVPEWGERGLCDVRTVAVEEWLRALPLANGSRAKIRNIMHALYNHAMRYEWTEKDPISLVRQSAKRGACARCSDREGDRRASRATPRAVQDGGVRCILDRPASL